MPYYDYYNHVLHLDVWIHFTIQLKESSLCFSPYTICVIRKTNQWGQSVSSSVGFPGWVVRDNMMDRLDRFQWARVSPDLLF
jgi:hypothetical protein